MLKSIKLNKLLLLMLFINSLWYKSKKEFNFIHWISFIILYPLSLVYLFIIYCRKKLYEKNIFKSFTTKIPIIIIGNIITGGAGKTPIVIALALALKKRGIKVGIISRGYGAKIDKATIIQPFDNYKQVGDEPLLIYKKTLLPICVHKNRQKSIEYLVKQHQDLQIIISDDGLQHLAMHRTIECVVFNNNMLGNQQLLPAGPLREKIRAWNYTLSTNKNINSIQPILEQSHSKHVYIERDNQYLYLLNNPLQKEEISFFIGKKALLLAGIAHPQNLAKFLEQNGLEVIYDYIGDHKPITQKNFLYASNDIEIIIITEKDAIKASKNLYLWAENIPIWVITLEVNLPTFFIDDIAHLAHNTSTSLTKSN